MTVSINAHPHLRKEYTVMTVQLLFGGFNAYTFVKSDVLTLAGEITRCMNDRYYRQANNVFAATNIRNYFIKWMPASQYAPIMVVTGAGIPRASLIIKSLPVDFGVLL